jgi:TetR/AcrR family transcriptional regulator, lmrAB and yxaGH operons repressor
MPVPPLLMSREKLLDRVLVMFRENGYDGTSVSDITAATGLGKSSLYHHFPGGKEEIAVAVLEHLGVRLRPALEALADDGPPQAKLAAFLDAVDALYDGGRMACLLERLSASADRGRFAEPLKASFAAFMNAFERLGREAGLSRAEARARAEDAVVRIEGSLVLAAGTEDASVFQRALTSIRATLLAPAVEPARARRPDREN